VDEQELINRTAAALWMDEGLELGKKEKFEEAIHAYSMGLSFDPLYDRLYRHRGHRYISISDYPKAAADLFLATRLDGEKRDSWYHLGLAFYLLRDFHRAEIAYEKAISLAASDQELISTIDWLWMTLMNLGKREEARVLLERVEENMDPGENSSYFERVMLYKGRRKIEDLLNFKGAQPPEIELANQGYGLATYLHVMGDEAAGDALLKKIVEECPKKSAFGYKAAEADLRSRGLL
jgi:tetratricopeptide (TPR) repeat protein